MKLTPFSVKATEPLPAPDTSFLFHSNRPWVMGVLNVTPDSFFPGSRGSSFEQTLALADRMASESADLLDIGGESTRPGSSAVSGEEERARVLPVLERLRERYPNLPLSVDTQKAQVARLALEAGAAVINDVSALRADPEMVHVAAQAQCPVVLMHMQGTPRNMQDRPRYQDVVDEVRRFFVERLSFAVRHGVREERIVLDPGIGFGKTLEHNLLLLKQVPALAALGRPLLIGVSRKSFIGRLLEDEAALCPVEDRLEGSLAAGLWAVNQGARGLRVHDVKATRQALRVWEALAAS